MASVLWDEIQVGRGPGDSPRVAEADRRTGWSERYRGDVSGDTLGERMKSLAA